MSLIEIDNRYSKLAESTCCLSCGGAVNYAQVANGEVCIDLGSGRGTDAIRMAEEAGKDGFVYGIDISEGMITKATQTAQKLNVTNVEFKKSNLENIQLPSDVANLVISNCTLNHAENKQQVWNEVYRILKKGGRFVVSDIYSIEPVPAEYRNNPEAVAECWAGAVIRSEYLQTLEIAGFTNIKIIEESTPYEKGKIRVASWTIAGFKPSGCCCGG